MMHTATLRVRRMVVLGAFVAVIATAWLAFGHRGQHVARGLLFPGAGLVDERPLLAALCLAATVVATLAWLRWGADWLVATAAGLSVVLSALAVPVGQHASGPVPDSWQASAAAHEFPLVLIVVAVVAWLRALTLRVPLIAAWVSARHRRRAGLGDVGQLPPVDRSRTAAVLALVGGELAGRAAAVAADPEVVERARRVGLVARFRTGGDPLRHDHAHARAALALTGRADREALDRLIADTDRHPLGVVCSEPGWVRPLDATLVALAVSRAGVRPTRWTSALEQQFALDRGHRPAWWWTPLGIGAGSMPAWEHATTACLARAAGWIDHDRDWEALRRTALGASARGTSVAADERLIAAARILASLAGDTEAGRLLARPTVRHDPLAVAIDLLARRLADDPSALAPRGLAPTERTFTA
jgi:hypothetical protein